MRYSLFYRFRDTTGCTTSSSSGHPPPLPDGRANLQGGSLRWDQVDFEEKLIRLDHNVKTPGSAEPVPLSEYACEVLQAWNKAQAPKSPFIFPSPHLPDRPISTVKTAWRATLRRVGVPHFPIYPCGMSSVLSGVAADAVVQRAMRHTSPETKRRYQLGMTDQVRQAVERANKKAYGRKKLLRFYDVRPDEKKVGAEGVCN